MQLTHHQNEVFEKIIRNDSLLITYSGLAGTGKTTMLKFIIDYYIGIDKRVVCVAYTGKAVNNIRLKTGHSDCMTIHSLIYKPIISNGVVIGYRLKDKIEYDIIILDEASMIDLSLFAELQSFNIPIIGTGDHGQLEPIDNTGGFSLVREADYVLTEVHRQAQESPILTLAYAARNGIQIPIGMYGNDVIKSNNGFENARLLTEFILNAGNSNSIILTNTNYDRVRINNIVRKDLGYNSFSPMLGEKVICLKNNSELGIYNGQSGIILEVIEESVNLVLLRIDMDGDEIIVKALKSAFNAINVNTSLPIDKKINNEIKGYGKYLYFAFSYAISVHKAQGSEWENVLLIDSRNKYQDNNSYNRWLYTAITRASKKLIILENF